MPAYQRFHALAHDADARIRDLSFQQPAYPEGPVDGYQLLLVAMGHAERHTEQLAEALHQLRAARTDR